MLTLFLVGLLAGFVCVIVAPALARPLGYGPQLGNSYARFVAKALKRPAIGVGKHGDLKLTKLTFDETYEKETLTSGGVERKVTRTAKNVHRLGKTPFAFVDEHWGVTFDLRDVLVGGIEHQLRDDGEMVRTHVEFDEEGEPTKIDRFVRAFFEIDERQGLDMDIDRSVRPIVDGGAKATWWEHLYEKVRRMYILRQQDMSVWKMMLPFGVFVVTWGLGFYLLGPGPMPGTAGQEVDPIAVGTLFLVGGGGLRETLGQLGGGDGDDDGIDIPWRLLGKIVLGLLTMAGLGVVTLGVGVVNAGLFAAGAGVGVVLVMFAVLVGGATGYGATIFGELLLMAGLMGFREPVLDLTEDDQYEFVEAADVGLEGCPKKRLAKTLIGWTCDVSPEAFGNAGYSAADVEDYRSPMADGGRSPALPRGMVPAEIQNSNLRGMMPNDPDPGATYVRTDSWLSRFSDAATGDDLDTAEEEAKAEFAAGDPKYDDGALMKWSGIAAGAGAGFWVVVSLVF